MSRQRSSSPSRRAGDPANTFARLRCLALLIILSATTFASVGVGAAAAQAGWWHITSESAPTNLPPGQTGLVTLEISDLGDAPINGVSNPIKIIDRLPAGLKAISVPPTVKNGVEATCAITAVVECTYAGILNPYEQLPIKILLQVEEAPGAVISLSQEADVEGGGVDPASSTIPLRVNGDPTQNGVATFEMGPFNDDGTPATQAGSQPFQLTTTVVLNQTRERNPIALPKDLSFNLPPGLVGNPTSATQCKLSDFAALVEETNLCPASTVVGVATLLAHEPATGLLPKTVPVFNLVPSQGEPARFGFEVLGKIPVLIDSAVRSGKDYGVVVSANDATETAGLLSTQVTFWGDPGDPRHNATRGWECVAGGFYAKEAKKGPCPLSSAEAEKPFLRLPTSCAANLASEPFTSSVSMDSWAEPAVFVGAEYSWMTGAGQPLGFEGCDQLPFTPSIDVTPTQHIASTPTGLSVDVKVPQTGTLEPGALAEADVRDTTVTLPAGVQLSPSAANGLEACSESEVGFTGVDPASQTNEFNTSPVSCPDGSKLGTVQIKTPLLSHELEGSVYLASPAPNGETGRNPFKSLVALYLVAEDPVSGVLVKLAGEGELDEGTLRVATTFPNAPQVPFEDLKLDLFDGPRAAVTTPASCGAYATAALFTPWSGSAPVGVSSPAEDFAVGAGVGGSPCPAGTPFAPGFLAQSETAQAGAFTGFTLELARRDGDQALRGLSMHLPAGIAAMLSSVTLCSEAQADADACPSSSEVGRATAIAGLGADPYTETGGRVFITGPYHGAPFGLEIVTPAVAGPFDLGTVTVRSTLQIDPNNASVTITSDPLPTQLRGIPLQLKRVIVNVDRPNFEFNPTNCNPLSIEAKITGDQGSIVPLSTPFKASNCASLPFKPKLTASTKGQASKANGANFDVKVESKGLGQANIAKVLLQLPKALPARLTTLQKACTEGAFNANPASCPTGSVIGAATIHTPVLSSPLSGPAYLVSHGGAAFPDVEFVLQGEGITLVLDGKTQIKNQITYSKFESAPDAPFTVFETVLPGGPHSALTTNVPERAKFNLCSSSLSMPTEITGQNGAVIKQTTKIALQGCKTVKSSRPTKLIRAQLLKRALSSCRKQHRHAPRKRVACERRARHVYSAKKAHKAKRTRG